MQISFSISSLPFSFLIRKKMLLKKRERDLERQVMIFFEMIAQVYKYMLKLELNVLG